MKPWMTIVLVGLAGCGSQTVSPTLDGGGDHRLRDTVARAAADAGSAPVADAATETGADAGRPPTGEPGDPPGSDDGGATETDAGADHDGGSDAPTPDGGVVTGTRSPGCGRAATGTGSFDTRAITVGGAARTYRVFVPRTYDPDRAYPVVFRWHGAGGDGLSGGLGIEYASGEDAIVVSGDAVGGWWNLSPTGPDLAYFDALHAEVTDGYCVDESRLYSYGFSRGGGFTNLLACVRSDVLRASAAVAGLAVSGATCGGPVATWLLHDRDDGAVGVWNGVDTRDRMVATNGCAATTTAVAPSPCVQYDGCDAAHPVVWCETTGFGHNIRGSFAPAAVWAFFESLP